MAGDRAKEAGFSRPDLSQLESAVAYFSLTRSRLFEFAARNVPNKSRSAVYAGFEPE
ncbi:hypothetical protein HGG76_00700 [Ochrobactrum tritici]|uniref:Uncharacterized protein n=1 Tax=Brucella tritici TaxID=94626 RepID=A0A7X6FNN4_9HYPH|nr:hypothetical protein [Brucella tritici]